MARFYGSDPSHVLRDKSIERIVVTGSIYVLTRSTSSRLDSFTIDGHGWHQSYYGNVDAVDRERFLGSADYSIDSYGPYSIQDLDSEDITLRVRVDSRAAMNSGGRFELYGTDDIFLRIHVKKVGHLVYVLNAERVHDVGMIRDPWKRRKDGRPKDETIDVIGELRFPASSAGRLVFDLRESESWLVRTLVLRDDYASMMAAAARSMALTSSAQQRRVYKWNPVRSCEEQQGQK